MFVSCIGICTGSQEGARCLGAKTAVRKGQQVQGRQTFVVLISAAYFSGNHGVSLR